MNQFLDRTFRLRERNTTVSTEVLAGLTTFMTMAYILAVNPGILSAAGMDFSGVFTATALSALLATLIMGLYANLPFALAPGMGLNAFFAFTVVKGMGFSVELALTAVLVEGLLFILLTALNVREAILNSIPLSLKKSISVGIGLFIAFIGLYNAGEGIVCQGKGIPLDIGDITTGAPLLTIIGLVITGGLLVFKVRGALFLGILATTAIGIPLGITTLPKSVVSAPPAPLLFHFDWHGIFTVDFLFILFTFLFVDMFDTVGTLVGVATKADMLDEQGRLPAAKKALFADAVGTTVGACLGTSTVTTYVESAAGVAEGGRSGLSAAVTGFFFLLALFFAPLFAIIPGAATAPVLILIGLFMLSPVKEIDFDDYTEAIPAFLTFIIMPLTYSIANGIMWGVTTYIIFKTIAGRVREVPPFTWGIAALFLLKILFPLFMNG
ncbi:MAG: guanine permease [Chloroflexi bacterium]|nr:MAG: guanine permease [Chloroflexota bacterium]